MKNLSVFIPTGFGIAMGAGIGASTQSLPIGIAAVIIFSLASKVKMSKSNS